MEYGSGIGLLVAYTGATWRRGIQVPIDVAMQVVSLSGRKRNVARYVVACRAVIGLMVFAWTAASSA